MKYWLAKSEPDVYGWDDMVKEKEATWDGVRNYGARNNLMAMEMHDKVLIYHSNIGKEVVGIAEVSKEHFPDPSDHTGKWASVKFKPLKKLKKPIPLSFIKTVPELKDMVLVNNTRLSVQPVTEEEFEKIVALSEE